MAEYFVVPHAKANLAPIPDDISSEAAVYACDMLSTGFMGAEHCYLRLGDTAAVFAQGAVGLSATIGLSLLGASRIFAVESVPNRQELSKAYGATDIIDFSEGDAVEQIREATDGEGVDAAVEALGFPQTWESCLRVTKAGGRTSATTARTRIRCRSRSMHSASGWRTSPSTVACARAATTACSGSSPS